LSPTASSPQAEQMADESMVRNLRHQANALWPQEVKVFERHGLAGGARVLDVGCGTGELVARLAERFPTATFVGVDLEAPHLERARRTCAKFGARTMFQAGDALALPFEPDAFDLVLCRHVLQALPDPVRATAEMQRVVRPGGRLHVLAEDYGMMWCHPTPLDSDGFWQALPQVFARAIGCDNHIGRKMFTVLTDLGMSEVQVDYLVADTVRVPRETFAGIWESWRDGYTDALVRYTQMPREEITRRWNEMIACVRDPRGYALWQVPVWSARKA
jgi:SAM-dependent methyltransferase